MRLKRKTKRRLLVLIAAVLACTIGFSALGLVRHAQQQRLIEESRTAGLAAYAAHDLSATLQHLSYYFQHEKSDLEANLTFAEARARVPIVGGRHLLEAIDLYSTHGLRLIEDHPELDPEGARRLAILNRLLDLYSQSGFRFEIIQTADRLLAGDPNHVRALGAKAEVLCLQREHEAAAPLVKRAMELEPDSLRWRRLYLEIMAECGFRAEQRIELCRAWADDYTGDGRFHALIAATHLALDQTEPGRRELHKAVQRGAASKDVLQGVVELLDVLEEREMADALIASTVQAYPEHDWPRVVSIHRHWRANEIDEATAEIDTARVDGVVFTSDALKLQIKVMWQAGRQSETAAALQELARQCGPESAHDAMRAWIAAVNGAIGVREIAWTQTLHDLRHALSHQPNDSFLHFLMGHVWASKGETTQALLAYERAARLDPAWVMAGIAHAEALRLNGRYHDAFAASRIVVSRAPKHQLKPLLVLTRAYLAWREAGELGVRNFFEMEIAEDLLEVLERVYEEQPDHEELITTRAQALAQLKPVHAVEFIKEVVERGENRVGVLLQLADISLQRQLDLHNILVQRAIEQSGMTPEVALRAARIAAATGDAIGGLRVLDNALATADPNGALVSHRCARVVFMIEHDLPGVDLALRDLLALHPDAIQAQQVALWHANAVEHADIMVQAAANLKDILGATAPQVRLAEAHVRLQQWGKGSKGETRDDASLARAIVQIEGVLRQSPDSLAALSLMADAMMLSRPPNIERAVECLERAVGLYNNQRGLALRLITTLQQRGDYERAGRHLRALARAGHDLSVRSAELQLWNNQADVEAALAHASQFVNESSPPPDQLILAAMHHRAGQRDKAEAIYERLLAAPDVDALTLAQSAEFFAATGRFERGLELMHALLELRRAQLAPPSQPDDLLLGSFCQRYGRWPEAREHLHRAVAQHPDSPEARNELARLYLALDDRAAARAQAVTGLAVHPTHAALRATFAAASLTLTDHERQQSIQTLREIGGENQDLVAMLQLLANIPFQDGKPAPTELNLVHARRLVEENGRFLPAWQLAIMLHAQAGRSTDAVRLARSAVTRFPDRPEPCQWATQLLTESGKWREALAEAMEWRTRAWRSNGGSGSEPLGPDCVIASILLQLHRPGDAIQQLELHAETLAAQREQSPDRFTLWIRVLALGGQYARAIELIESLLNEPRWRMVWLSIAAHLHQDYGHAALSMLEPHVWSAEERIALAFAWIALDRAFECPECLDRAAVLAAAAGSDPAAIVPALMVRASIAEQRQEWDEAEALYRRALEREPNNPVALNNLAYVLTHMYGRCDEALPLIQKVIESHANQPEYLDTYAHVLLGLGRASEAQAQLMQALELRPDDLMLSVSRAEAQFQLQQWGPLQNTLALLQQRFTLEPPRDRHVRERFQNLQKRFEQARQDAATAGT